MKSTIQVRIHKGESQYVAECIDLPIVTQGRTLDELAANVREAIDLHLEGEDLSELDLVPNPAVVATFEIEPIANVKA